MTKQRIKRFDYDLARLRGVGTVLNVTGLSPCEQYEMVDRGDALERVAILLTTDETVKVIARALLTAASVEELTNHGEPNSWASSFRELAMNAVDVTLVEEGVPNLPSLE
ncbi:MAG TPA: hypothetical protein VLG25_00050 [Patescibacteria group bacterium]|nr:hypothetical protein [Patescibacteria group bacterium]